MTTTIDANLPPMAITTFLAMIGKAMLVALIAVLFSSTAQAQMFGARALGNPIEGRRGAAQQNAVPEVGVIEGSERFLRENRDRNDFVGSNRSSLQGFVGSEQAIGTGRVRAATETLRAARDASNQLNRPIPPLRANAMYFPRLMLDASFQSHQDVIATRTTKRDARLEKILTTTAGNGPIEVIQVGDRTILRGVVPSEAVAEKLRILASFEPHINEIESQLVIQSN